MTKHTPGPWVLYKLPDVEQSTDEWHANARLIAAAPELLEVLVRALPEISVCATADILEQARSAIAKATGETK